MNASEAKKLSLRTKNESYFKSEQFVKDNQGTFDLIKMRAKLGYTCCTVTLNSEVLKGLEVLGYEITDTLGPMNVISWD